MGDVIRVQKHIIRSTNNPMEDLINTEFDWNNSLPKYYSPI